MNDLKQHFHVADGLKYGADFILYKENVDKEHGFGLVFIKDEPDFNHNENVILVRICESTRKKGYIAHVNKTTDAVVYEYIYRLRTSH